MRVAVVPTPAATANPKMEATAYTNTLVGNERFLNHSIMFRTTSDAAFSSPYSSWDDRPIKHKNVHRDRHKTSGSRLHHWLLPASVPNLRAEILASTQLLQFVVIEAYPPTGFG